MANSSLNIWASKLDQVLQGTVYNDILGGFNGATRLVGGKGNDIYYVLSNENVVVEAADEGIDTVITWKSHTLAQNVENLQVLNADTYGIGNELANVIIGGAGRQQLFGGAGNDTLTGGAGNDVFIVRPGSGSDTIIDFDFEVGKGGDTVQLGQYGLRSFAEVVVQMRQAGSDVVLQLKPGETLTFQNLEVANFQADDFQYALDRSALKLTFSEEFDALKFASEGGTWRTTYWDGDSGRTLDSNGEKQIYMDKAYKGLGVDPFSIQNGVLTIHADKASGAVKAATGFDYTSGMLSSMDKFAQTYGYFEMRAELPGAKGTWPAFWLLPADGTWPPELDVFETVGDGPQAYMTAHSKSSGTHTKEGISSWVGDMSGGMHTYGVLWNAKELIWYVDGAEVFRAPTPADMHMPMYLLTNLAIGGHWPGNPEAGFGGAELKIDYIRAYEIGDAASAGATAPVSAPAQETGAVVAGPDVSSAVSAILAEGKISLTLTGTSLIDAVGNALNNSLVGNSGNNVLDGKAGADTMAGGAGDDVYHVEHLSDVVVELPGEGIDTVYASISHTLAANVENGVLTGGGWINLIGNDLGNVMTGNSGNNVLDGRGSADKMIGGAGNDTYYVDNVGDVVVELAGGGNDTVYTSITHTLSDNVENGALTGSGWTKLFGNSLDNTLTGNSGNNWLVSGMGNDVLIGGAGSDTLVGGGNADTMTGGEGNDVFKYYSQHWESMASQRDTITDFSKGDVIDLSEAYAGTLRFLGTTDFTGRAGELRLEASGKDVVVSVDMDGDGRGEMAILLGNVSIGSLGASDFLL